MNTEIENKLKKIPERLKILEETLNLTKTEISKKSGMSRSFYSNIATGSQTPSFDFLQKICSTFDVSMDWLIYGEGQMFRENNEFISKLEQYYILMVKKILSKPQEERMKILKAIDSILDI